MYPKMQGFIDIRALLLTLDSQQFLLPGEPQWRKLQCGLTDVEWLKIQHAQLKLQGPALDRHRLPLHQTPSKTLTGCLCDSMWLSFTSPGSLVLGQWEHQQTEGNFGWFMLFILTTCFYCLLSQTNGLWLHRTARRWRLQKAERRNCLITQSDVALLWLKLLLRSSAFSGCRQFSNLLFWFVTSCVAKTKKKTTTTIIIVLANTVNLWHLS